MKKLLLLFNLLLLPLLVFGQQQTITGTITDAKDGSPMIGVNVTVAGTSTGAITDYNGNFSIKVNNAEDILIFSFIGYTSQKITVGSQTQVNVSLAEDVTELDQVVVVGYGTSKKKDLTGAITSVKSEDLQKAGATTTESLLQGKVSGVQIVSNNGEPGAGAQIKIRGSSSIRANGQPLYVIDGVPMDMEATTPDGISGTALGGAPATSILNSINPNDIESIDILKDASASAIYGSRGAAGVIIITTKKGREGVSEINYSATITASELPKKLEVMDASTWVKYRKDSLRTTELNYGDTTDWQDQIFRKAISTEHNLSFTGGNAKSNYRVALNYTNQEGIIKKSDLTRYNGRLSLIQKALNDRITFETNINASQVIENRVPVGATGFEGDLLLNALQANPTWPVYDSITGAPFQGTTAMPFTGSDRNPIAMLNYTTDLTRTTSTNGSLAATVKITSDLSFKANVGANYSNANRFIDQSQKLIYTKTTGGVGQINNKEVYNYLAEYTLNYNKTIEIHSFNVLVGYSFQEFNIRGNNTTGGGYITDNILYSSNIGAGMPTYTSVSSYFDNHKMQSYFGRINYNLMERYLITATMRADGSTKFGTNKKYGYFPSLAFAWRMSEEEFIKNLDIFSNLKVRVGWGQTGNSEIPTRFSQYIFIISNGSKANVNGKTILGLDATRTPNPKITWETTTSTDIGLDWGILKGRLSGSIDYFKKVAKDLLMEVPTKSVSPTSTWYKNIDSCTIENNGIELGLNAIPFTGKFGWEVSFNFTTLSNVVKKLPVKQYQTGSAQGQGLTGAYVQVIASNQPVDEFYGLSIDSISRKGKVYYKKTANGKKDSLYYLGNPQPKFTWSLTNKFNYGNFDLNIFIEGVHGNKIFNNTALLLDKANLGQSKNSLKYLVYDKIKAMTYTPNVSDRYIEDGSYIRLSSVTLGYNFKPKNSPFKNIRLYIAGSNLFIITDYKGYDPDVSAQKSMAGINSFGIDITSYPKARSYTGGLSITF